MKPLRRNVVMRDPLEMLKMKRTVLLLSLVVILVLGACQLPAPGGGPPAVQDSPTATEQSVFDEATPPSGGEQGGGQAQDQPQPTATQPPAVTNTQPAPTATSAPPTATQPAADALVPSSTPTKTRQPAVAFDPYTTYGKPKYQNDMVVANFNEWAPPETGKLPDNENLQLSFKDGKLYVTGKQRGFSTWWFTYHELKNFYLEMTFDTETCSGNDAYGMILRGPEHKAGVSYGYVIAFTCDGKIWAFRLDGTNPWQVNELIDEYPSGYVNAGSDKLNVIGVRADGNVLSIVANGYLLETIQDNKYSQGRFGVFVRAADTRDYTYRLTKFAYWILGETP
jgi:hypothetical protein